jgi:MOSC domain-containing protein YiiM
MNYPIIIRHIFISPGHNYFGRPKDGPGPSVTHDLEQVEARAGLGLVGDRYFGVAAHFEAQVTFIAWEVIAGLQRELGLAHISPALTRRNIVVEGVNLNQLIGHEFAIEGSHGSCVRFLGTKSCSPCAWMDAMLAPGAHQFLKGRGGLRARVLSDGVLAKGPAILHAPIELDLVTVAEPLAKPRLP